MLDVDKLFKGLGLSKDSIFLHLVVVIPEIFFLKSGDVKDVLVMTL